MSTFCACCGQVVCVPKVELIRQRMREKLLQKAMLPSAGFETKQPKRRRRPGPRKRRKERVEMEVSRFSTQLQQTALVKRVPLPRDVYHLLIAMVAANKK